jgi:hypothetical protein
MSTSIIDGTVEEATFKRAFVKMQVWGPLVFRLRDGSTRTLDKVIIESSLAPYITPGNSGRFYCYAAIDHRGIHGVRTDQGEAHYAFARNNEVVSLISAGFGALLIAISLAFQVRITGWAYICLIIGVPGYFLYRETRLKAEKQFDADTEFVPAPAVAPAQ